MTQCSLVDSSLRNERTTANCKADSNVGPYGLCITNKQTRWSRVLFERLSSLASHGTSRILWNALKKRYTRPSHHGSIQSTVSHTTF